MSRRADRCTPEFRVAVGKRVRRMRKSCGLTLRDAGEAIGMSYVALCQVELGNSEPTATTLLMLSDLFGCSIDFLVKGTTHDRCERQAADL